MTRFAKIKNIKNHDDSCVLVQTTHFIPSTISFYCATIDGVPLVSCFNKSLKKCVDECAKAVGIDIVYQNVQKGIVNSSIDSYSIDSEYGSLVFSKVLVDIGSIVR